MRIVLEGPYHDIRELLCRIIGCRHHEHKPKARLLVFTFGPDEPIPKDNMPTIVLTAPLKPGFRRPFTLTFDEPVDVRSDGVSYVSTEAVDGDSTVTLTSQSPTEAAGFLNGDGATGVKTVRFSADGHVGVGDVEITQDVEYSVISPDATIIGFAATGTDEPIPAPPTP